MTTAVTYECPQCPSRWDCGDILITYVEPYDEYGLVIHDGGTSFVLVAHCPWCGTKLPESKRDAWFERLESMGFDDPFEQAIPAEFRTGEWYEGTT